MGIFIFCLESAAEYTTNQTILQKIRYIAGKQEYIVRATYTITQIKETKSIGEGIFSKRTDGKFIVVRFKVHNKSNNAIPLSKLTNLMLMDSKKRRWEQSLGATGSMRLGTDSFVKAEIDANETIEDVIVFDVPENVNGYFIVLPGGAKVSSAVQSARRKKASKGVLSLPVTSTKSIKTGQDDKIPKKAKENLEGKSLQELLDAANTFYREGRCEDFISANENAIKIASKQNNLSVQGKLHYNVAECYARLNKYDDAKRHLESAISIGAKIKDAELEILALIDKSRIFLANGDKSEATKIFRSVSERSNKEIFLNIAVSDHIKALVSLQMAAILLDMGEKDKAQERLEYALMVNNDFKLEENITNILKTSGLPLYKEISRIDALLDKAWTLYERGDYKEMEMVSRDAVDAARKLGYKTGVFGGNYYIAMALINMEGYDKAIDYALYAQELSEKGHDKVRLGMVYNIIGNIFKQKRAYEKALYYYNKYLDIVKSTGNREGEAVVLSNIGNVLIDKGEYRDALKYYEDSLKVSLEIGTVRHIIAQAYLSIGRVLKKLGDYKNAEKSIVIAINIFRELGNEGGEVVGLWEMAGNYALQRDYQSAIKILEDNLGRAEKLGMKQNFIDDLIVNAEKNKDYLRLEKYKSMKTN